MKFKTLIFLQIVCANFFLAQNKVDLEQCYEKFSNDEIENCITNLNIKKEKEFEKIFADLTIYLNAELKLCEPMLAEIYKIYLEELPQLKSSLIKTAKSMSIIKSAENLDGSGMEIFKQEAYYAELIKNLEIASSINENIKKLKQ
jgi:hypothetical protein